MDSDTVERLETKLAFLERTTAELSDVIYRQQREIDALNAKLIALASRFDTSQTEERARTPEEERPPHY
jgi:SlyX protein